MVRRQGKREGRRGGKDGERVRQKRKRWRAIEGAGEEGERERKRGGKILFLKSVEAIKYPLAIPIPTNHFCHLFAYSSGNNAR